MAVTDFINSEALCKYLVMESREKMIVAAEPVIQEAMKEIEKKLRAELGSIVVGLINADYSIQKMQGNLQITVFNKEI